MAQVKSGALNTDSEEGRWLRFDWYVTKQDAEGNYTDIGWSLSGGGVSGYVSCCNFKVVIDGATVYEANGWVDVWLNQVVASGTKRIYHNDDGTKKFQASVNVSIYSSGDRSSGVKNFELPTLFKSAKITSFSVNKKDETSVAYNFVTDVACDYAWYSTDNGTNWHDLPNTNIISGLSANTTYQFKLRVRNKETQLTTDSQAYQQSTYNYPHCTNSHDFTIGDALTLELYNPLGRSIDVRGYAKSNDAEIFSGNTTGNKLVGFNDNGSVNNQYASIPNSTSGAYKVVVYWNGISMERDVDNVYKIKGNEVPTLNAFRYIDNNPATFAITKNDQLIVQNKSIVRAEFHAATANYGAGGISYYVLECNGTSQTVYGAGAYDIGTIDSIRNVDLKFTAYDSRGLSASQTINISMVAYEPPKATVELKRLNNYEDTTYLTVDGSVSNVGEKTSMLIQYQYKESGGEYGSFATLTDGVRKTFDEKEGKGLDKNKSYIFHIVVTDAFGETFDKEFVLNKGLFPLFIDTVKNSVGINCFPTEVNSLEVNGFNVYGMYKCEKNILLFENANGLKITIDSFGGTDKFALIVAGADNASITPVYKVIRIKDDGGFGEVNLGLNSATTAKKINGKVVIHIAASQWSYFTVKAPFGCEITLSNSAL